MWEKNKNLLPHSGEAYLYHSFFTAFESEQVFTELSETIEWKPGYLNEYGIAGKYDKHPGKEPLPWTNILLDIKQFIEDRLDLEFNSALLSLYHEETAGVGWHSDNEPGLGINPVIASLSFGGSRDFQLKRKGFPGEKVNAILEDGSLLLMQETQGNWLHRFCRSSVNRHPTINITFRKIIS